MGHDLVHGEDPWQEALARPQPRGHGGGVLHAQLETASGVGAGTLELGGATGSGADALELAPDGGDHLLGLVGVEAGVHPERAAVGVARGEGGHVIGQRAPLAELQEQAAAHPVAKHRAEEVERPAVVGCARETPACRGTGCPATGRDGGPASLPPQPAWGARTG